MLAEEKGFAFKKWREFIKINDPSIVTSLKTFDGFPAFMEKNNFSYLAGIPNEALLEKIIVDCLKKSGLPVLSMPDSVRLVKDDLHHYFTNYGNQTKSIKKLINPSNEILLGKEGN